MSQLSSTSLPEQGNPTTQIRFTRVLALFSGRGAQEGYLAAIDQGVISLANFMATLILARNVSPTELGMYGVGFTCLRLARVIQEGITTQPINIIGAAMPEHDFRHYASAVNIIQVALAILSAIGVALVGFGLIFTGNDTAGPTLFALWFPFLTWQYDEYTRRVLYARGRILPAVINSALGNAVRIGLMVFWAANGRLTGISGLEAIGWGSLIALAPGLWQTRRYWTRRFESFWPTLQRNWKFGKWISGSVLTNWLSVEFYPVLTAGLVSFAAAGAYRAIQNLVAPIQLLLRAMDSFLTPRASKIYTQTGLPGQVRILRITYLVIGIPVSGILTAAVVFRYEILTFLYGDTYLEYSNAVILMAIFYGLLFIYWPLQTVFKAIRLSRPIFIANGIAIIAMFTIGVWAIFQWGIYGTLLGQILNASIVAGILWVAWLGIVRRRSV